VVARCVVAAEPWTGRGRSRWEAGITRVRGGSRSRGVLSWSARPALVCGPPGVVLRRGASSSSSKPCSTISEPNVETSARIVSASSSSTTTSTLHPAPTGSSFRHGHGEYLFCLGSSSHPFPARRAVGNDDQKTVFSSPSYRYMTRL
jgi:hypothetical protein